ncbi:MAG: hypothetical protein ACR2QH_15275 [Geminicoccaceae bacterium]
MTPNTSAILAFPQPVMPEADSVRQSDSYHREVGKLPMESQNDELFAKLKEWFDEGRDRSYKWRTETEEAYDLVNGWQWDLDDVAILNEDGRPTVTFNRIGRNVDLIIGQEIQAKQEVTFLPRENGDVEKSEILSAAIQYITDETDANDEKSDAFRDLCICGLGWTETRMDYRDFPEGMIVEERRDPLEMYWDPHSIRRNMKDSRWRARAITIPTREAVRKFPGVNPAMLTATWANIQDDPSNPSDPDRQSYNYDDSPVHGRPPLLQRVTIIEMQWWEIEDMAIVEDLYTGERTEMKKGRANALVANIPGRYTALPVERKVYHKAFLGGIILGHRIMEEASDFTFQPMTGKRDRRTGWYGIVRAMRDPQKWANKWLSQSMHIMNSNGKGGVMYEEGVFPDPRKAEQNWGKPGAFTRVTSGSLTEGRIQERQVGQLPTELGQHLLPFALDSIQECVGIPSESLGQTTGNDQNRSALFEQARREAGLTVMAYLFDSKRLFNKRQGRLQLNYILKFMNDGRLIRMVEEGQQRYVQMVFDDPDVKKYDIVVDEAPDSPHQREKTWSILERFLPFIERLGAPPEFYAEMLPYAPLPAALAKSWRETLMKQGQQGQDQPSEGDQAKMIQAQIDQQKLPAELEKIKAETERLMADAKRLESNIVLNFAKAREAGARVEMDSLEGIRETIALDDARELGKMTAHEVA